jgi:hypothetical protein
MTALGCFVGVEASVRPSGRDLRIRVVVQGPAMST